MTVTRDDAAAALRHIDTAERRAQTAFGYRTGAPYLLLWGAVWIAAGAVGVLSPGHTGGLHRADLVAVRAGLRDPRLLVRPAPRRGRGGAFHFAPAHAALVVSLLGGGALILAGLWMRRAL